MHNVYNLIVIFVKMVTSQRTMQYYFMIGQLYAKYIRYNEFMVVP